MKKTILSIAIFFLTFSVFSQARIGSSASEIKAEFWESNYNLISGYSDNGTYYISIETKRAIVLYFFDNNRKCNSCSIIPNDQGDLNYYVELYNSKYVIISSLKWKMYSNGGYVRIELVYGDEGGYYFLWY